MHEIDTASAERLDWILSVDGTVEEAREYLIKQAQAEADRRARR